MVGGRIPDLGQRPRRLAVRRRRAAQGERSDLPESNCALGCYRTRPSHPAPGLDVRPRLSILLVGIRYRPAWRRGRLRPMPGIARQRRQLPSGSTNASRPRGSGLSFGSRPTALPAYGLNRSACRLACHPPSSSHFSNDRRRMQTSGRSSRCPGRRAAAILASVHRHRLGLMNSCCWRCCLLCRLAVCPAQAQPTLHGRRHPAQRAGHHPVRRLRLLPDPGAPAGLACRPVRRPCHPRRSDRAGPTFPDRPVLAWRRTRRRQSVAASRPRRGTGAQRFHCRHANPRQYCAKVDDPAGASARSARGAACRPALRRPCRPGANRDDRLLARRRRDPHPRRRPARLTRISPPTAANTRRTPGRAGRCAARIDPLPERRRVTAPKLSAIVLLDPLAALFDAEGLADVRMPVLLFRPEHGDVLREQGNADALAAALPDAAGAADSARRALSFSSIPARRRCRTTRNASMRRASIGPRCIVSSKSEIVAFFRENL